MTPTQFRRATCIVVMAFSGCFMAAIWSYITTQDLNLMTTASGVLLGSAFASLVALFKFAFDAIDGKIDAK